MAQITKYYCDFCSKESARKEFPKDELVMVSVKILSRRYCQHSQAIVEADELELCPACYEAFLNKAVLLADYICNHFKDLTSDIKEAAHE